MYSPAKHLRTWGLVRWRNNVHTWVINWTRILYTSSRILPAIGWILHENIFIFILMLFRMGDVVIGDFKPRQQSPEDKGPEGYNERERGTITCYQLQCVDEWRLWQRCCVGLHKAISLQGNGTVNINDSNGLSASRPPKHDLFRA